MNDPTNPAGRPWPDTTPSESPASAAGGAQTAARCALHPDAPAEGLCERCGSYACSSCMVWRPDGTRLCAPCSRRFSSGLYGSYVAIGAAVAGFFGLGCAPFGLLAVLLGAIDLVRIQTRQSPRGGWKLDALAIVLGVAGTVLWVYVVYNWLAEPEPYSDPYYYDDPYY